MQYQDTKEMPRPDWNKIAQALTERPFMVAVARDKKVFMRIVVESDTPELLDALFQILRIGTKPRQVIRYHRKDKAGKRGAVRKVWRWYVGKQLEIYWLLSNIKPFTRGAMRGRIEKNLRILEDALALHNRLLRVTTQRPEGEPAVLPDKPRPRLTQVQW